VRQPADRRAPNWGEPPTSSKMPDRQKLEQDLKDPRQKGAEPLCVMAMSPDLLPSEVLLLQRLERRRKRR